MIDFNRKSSSEREIQVPSHRMSTLVLLETLVLIKIVSVSVILFMYSINTTTGPDSKLKSKAIWAKRKICLVSGYMSKIFRVGR